MDFVIVGLTAFLASALTLFSGFGLGTLLLPAFALFFPPSAAVAATGVVHLLNNLFKGGLVGRLAHWPTVLRFGLPAVPAAILGAFVLQRLETGHAFTWSAFDHVYAPSWAAAVIGLLMVIFAVLELQPWFQRIAAPLKLLPLGGAVTGFLGGLTGQQGALRSMFLLKTGLEPARFIATGVVIAILVDVSRLPVYFVGLRSSQALRGTHELALLAFGALCAFAGAWLAVRYSRKVTIDLVRNLVAICMLGVGAALGLGMLGA